MKPSPLKGEGFKEAIFVRHQADSDFTKRALLPAGLQDDLPPDAALEAWLIERLVSRFSDSGYERVDPPLIEFEESLLAGGSHGLSALTFRVMDPLSQRMMGVRADITVQIARIATTRLGDQARPLRLCYAGDVLQVRGSQLRPERQFVQVGCELIGVDGVPADVEVVRLAAAALRAIGIDGLSVDLNAAPLVPAVFAAHGIAGERAQALRAALDRKDARDVAELAGSAAEALGGLLAATGPARAALMILTTIPLPDDAARLRGRLVEVVQCLSDGAPDLTLTLDPVENRGFEYYSGIGFTLFSAGARGELGRGGRYLAGGAGEPAIGCSLYMSTVSPATPRAAPRRRVFVPLGAPADVGEALRAEGWVTIAGLQASSDAALEAKRLGCGWRWRDGVVENIEAPRDSRSEQP